MTRRKDTACAVPECEADGAMKFRGRWMCDPHWLHVSGLGDLASESQLIRWGWPGPFSTLRGSLLR